MSIIDKPHRKQFVELAESVKDLLNRIGPKAVTPEEEQAVARVWLALQKPAIQALHKLEQTHIPFNQAEAEAGEMVAQFESAQDEHKSQRIEL